MLFFVRNCRAPGGVQNTISRKYRQNVSKMKVAKAIFFFIMSLIMILCIGVLACALNPSLTEMLAEKVENLSFVQSGGSSQPDPLSGDSGGSSGSSQDDPGQPDMDGTGAADGLADAARAGVNADWIRDGNQTGYEPPDSQSVEAPASVSGRTGYEPVQEEAQQIEPEEEEELAESAPLGNTGSELSFDPEFYPFYAMLETDLQSLYKQIYANAMDMVQSFSPVTAVNVNQLKTVFEAVYNDHPELFWLETGYSCKYLRNGSCVEITLKYNATASNLEASRQEFESRAGTILAAAVERGSDLEKEQYVHDSLMEQVEYVVNAPMNQSAYSALVNGRTVCAGYARAFQYLMQRLGIPCYYCTGYAGEDHAWNIIKLGEDYFNVDVTWDDTDTPTYDYFNKSDREFGTSHMRTGLAVYLPACVSGMDMQGNPVNGNDSGAGNGTGTGDSGNAGNGTGTGDSGNAGNGTGTGDSGNAGNGTGDGDSQPGTDGQESAVVLINPTPIEPLRWQGGSGTDADTDTDPEHDPAPDTESVDEAEGQEALDRAGISGEDVRDTMEAYYEDCGRLLREVGTGDRQFTNVIPKEMWSSVEQAYNNGAYRSGYVDDALEAMDADSFVILLQVQDIGGGYYRLYHNVYTN